MWQQLSDAVFLKTEEVVFLDKYDIIWAEFFCDVGMISFDILNIEGRSLETPMWC